MQTIPFYFDFISPYSWLALMRAEAFAAHHAIQFDMRPVVFGKLLDAHDLVGPAESPAKRRYTFLDVTRCAMRQGLQLVGPPAHPFRSLDALRVATLFARELEAFPALHLCVRLSHACWGEGRDLADIAVLESLVRELDLDADDLGARIARPEIKDALKHRTAEAIEGGVFGVPSFFLDGELFWGADRMNEMAERLVGFPRPKTDRIDAVLDRPRAVDRRRRPGSADQS